MTRKRDIFFIKLLYTTGDYCYCIFLTVIATANEPLPGWIDNLYGPTGIVTGVMTGIIKSLPCDLNAVTDLVPADLTVNALIAASWDTHVRYDA